MAPTSFLHLLRDIRKLGFRDVWRYRHFSEDAYRALYPDVAAAIDDGRLPSGRYHYLKYGRAEGRRASAVPTASARAATKSGNTAARMAARSDFLRDIGNRVAVGPGKIARELASGGGEEIVRLNRSIVEESKSAHAEHYGRTAPAPAVTLITCLYGSPHLLQIQVALFSASRSFDRAEFVYVNNSPELADAIAAEARQAAHVYDVPITVVTPRSNLGFGAANNVGARHARSDRLLLVNPDVFPKDADWLVAHNRFAATAQGKCFGACLYYDDGSVMHAGMYFGKDVFYDGGTEPIELLRVEHYAKGFPETAEEARTTRIVPAVTGAFISIDRGHFENLGGFDEDFIFGNYEDADLCLRSARAGVPVWYCADLRLWHMEGKGSVRRPEHEGASQVNRWLFTRKWRDDPALTVVP